MTRRAFLVPHWDRRVHCGPIAGFSGTIFTIRIAMYLPKPQPG